jgi:hypothetical protein
MMLDTSESDATLADDRQAYHLARNSEISIIAFTPLTTFRVLRRANSH